MNKHTSPLDAFFGGISPLTQVDGLVDELHTIIKGRTVAKTICQFCNEDVSEMDLTDVCEHMTECRLLHSGERL